MKLLFQVPSTQQIRNLESRWIAQCQSNWGQVLMELAGRSAAEQACDIWSEQGGNVFVLAGRGNNGGDGLVIARYLHIWGVPIRVLLVGQKDEQLTMSTDEGNVNLRIAEGMKIPLYRFDERFAEEVRNADLIIDALLGTGLDREVEGEYWEAIQAIDDSGKRVIAVDVPSGINSDTGQIMGHAVKAELTVTFGHLKSGLLCYPGAEHVGRISLVDIGLPPLTVESPCSYVITTVYVNNVLPKRPSNSHKGTFGHLLTIGGSPSMPGAIVLASQSALRVGVGLSVVASAPAVLSCLPPGEVIYKRLPENKAKTISSTALADVEAGLEEADAIVVGPGLSQEPDTVKFVHGLISNVLPKLDKPCVIDADGLNALATDKKVFPRKGHNFVLTPHPKELSRLLGKSVQEIQSDRIGHARTAAKRFGCIVVLKGARTIVADETGQAFINPTGNSGMATAGSGDVLSGIIGGLMAQGLAPLSAATAGVYIHGLAGDIAAKEIGNPGIVAGEISKYIPAAIAAITRGETSPLEQEILD